LQQIIEDIDGKPPVQEQAGDHAAPKSGYTHPVVVQATYR
jgi:hypothetical protein